MTEPSNAAKRKACELANQTDEALVECPKCERGGEDCGEHAPTWEELTAYWKNRAEDLTREVAKAEADAEMLESAREAYMEQP